MKYSFSFLMVLCFFAGITACKKTTDPVTTPGFTIDEPDFEVFGDLYVYSPIQFKSNFKESTGLTWYFTDVDEETIYGTEISHTYKTAGTYNVSMAVTDGFGGTVSKPITITNGTERLSGESNWNFFLKPTIFGKDPKLIPAQQFSKKFSLTIVDDTTIKIPTFTQLRIPGPFVLHMNKVTDSVMVFKSDDHQMEVSLTFHNFTAGMKITQVYRDTIWKLDGGATMYQ